MSLLQRLRQARRDVSEHRQVSGRRRAAEARLHRQICERAATHAARPPIEATDNRTLVLGLSANYGPADLAPFVLSLRGTGYVGDAVLFVCNTTPDTRRFLAAHRIRAIPFDVLPMLPMSMNSARMLRYLDFLEEQVLALDGTTPYAHVLLTDIRDVVFQGDPFARAAGADIHYYLEEAGRTVGGCPINARWMREALGEEGLRLTAASPISCAGTLLATPQALLDYLLQMCRLILEAPPLARYSGIDQAIHTYLMTRRSAGRAQRAVPNGEAVMTVPSGAPHGLRVMPDGRLRNPDGSFSEIVHQYDRDPALQAAVAGRWRCA